MYLPQRTTPIIAIFIGLLSFILLPPNKAMGQDFCDDLADPNCSITRIGLGVGTVLSAQNGFGLGLRARVSTRLNRDFSGAIDLGFIGFILRGRDQATIIFDPQVSGIISFEPKLTQSSDGGAAYETQTYLLGGIGAFVPLTNAEARQSGPSIHFGIGQARSLLDSVLYFELDPTIVVGATAVEFTLPIRLGLIFNGGNTTPRSRAGRQGIFNN